MTPILRKNFLSSYSHGKIAPSQDQWLSRRANHGLPWKPSNRWRWVIDDLHQNRQRKQLHLLLRAMQNHWQKTMSSHYYQLRNIIFHPLRSLSLLIFIFLAGCHPAWHIKHPYETVDWRRYGQYKANLHSHTMVSDGWINPQTVIAHYRRLDYKILAITDHMAVTYPWEKFSQFQASEKTKKRVHDRISKPEEGEAIPIEDLHFLDVHPDTTGLIDIQGGELKYQGHDILSYFSDYCGSFADGRLDTMAADNGMLVFAHPGRYQRPLDWYTDLFRAHDHLIGIEVFNCGNRYPHDRLRWDSLLVKLAAERSVWGFSNDDMHSLRDLGRDWNVMLLPALDHQKVRQAMKDGRFYFVHAPRGHKGVPCPIIHSIRVDGKKGTVMVNASAADSILWISMGQRIGTGDRLLLKSLPRGATYFRIEVYGAGEAIVCTQPFFIKRGNWR